MKKIIFAVLACLLALATLVGCGAKEEGIKSVDLDGLKTIGDVLALSSEEKQSAWSEGVYVRAFEVNGRFYRAIAKVPADVDKAIDALDIFDENHDEEFDKLVSPLEIYRIEDLSALIPPQEELDKLVGKTGQDLLDDEWTCGGGYNLDESTFWMYHGLFEYTVIFEGKVEPEEDFEEEEVIKDLVVKSVTFNMLGDVTDVELD